MNLKNEHMARFKIKISILKTDVGADTDNILT